MNPEGSVTFSSYSVVSKNIIHDSGVSSSSLPSVDGCDKDYTSRWNLLQQRRMHGYKKLRPLIHAIVSHKNTYQCMIKLHKKEIQQLISNNVSNQQQDVVATS